MVKYKLPHIGWNEISILRRIVKYLKVLDDKSHMYFVHSYEFIPEDKSTISSNNRILLQILFVQLKRNNIFGTQFHPEKSDKLGLKIINNFLEL